MSSNSEESSFDSSDSEVCNTSSEFFPSSDNSGGEDKDEDYLFPLKEYEWRKDKEPGDCVLPQFTVLPGIRVNVNSNDPLQMFELLFTDEMVNFIRVETNKVGNALDERLKQKYDWREISANEVKVMAATLIAQQMDYMVYLDRQPRFNENRVTLIYKLLSFTDDPEAKGALGKSKPFTEMVKKRFKAVYTPRQKLIVDERMTFMAKGSISMRNYCGLGSYCVSESLSGYIYNFILHIAKPDPDTRELDSGYKTEVLYSLMQDLFGKGYHIYTMNYYNSLELAMEIRQKETGFVGSMRPKIKNFPAELRAQQLKVGEGDYRYEKSGKMLLLKWNFKRDAYLVSTIHHGDDTVEVIKKKKPTVVPKLIAEYESADENVQFEDFCLDSFHFERSKPGITYRRVFRHLLNFIVSNAHALHKINSGPLKFVKFKMQLCNALIEKYL